MELGRETRAPYAGEESNRDDNSNRDDLEKQSIHDNDGLTPDPAAEEKPVKDLNVVDWDGPEDPENPMNWPLRKKVTAIGIVSVLAFLSYVPLPPLSSLFCPTKGRPAADTYQILYVDLSDRPSRRPPARRSWRHSPRRTKRSKRS